VGEGVQTLKKEGLQRSKRKLGLAFSAKLKKKKEKRCEKGQSYLAIVDQEKEATRVTDIRGGGKIEKTQKKELSDGLVSARKSEKTNRPKVPLESWELQEEKGIWDGEGKIEEQTSAKAIQARN